MGYHLTIDFNPFSTVKRFYIHSGYKGRFYTVSGAHSGIKTVQALALNLLTTIHPSLLMTIKAYKTQS